MEPRPLRPLILGASTLEEVHNYKSEKELRFSALLTHGDAELELQARISVQAAGKRGIRGQSPHHLKLGRRLKRAGVLIEATASLIHYNSAVYRERKGGRMESRQLIGVGIGALVGAVLGLVIGRMAFDSEIAGYVGIALGVAIGVALWGAWARR